MQNCPLQNPVFIGSDYTSILNIATERCFSQRSEVRGPQMGGRVMFKGIVHHSHPCDSTAIPYFSNCRLSPRRQLQLPQFYLRPARFALRHPPLPPPPLSLHLLPRFHTTCCNQQQIINSGDSSAPVPTTSSPLLLIPSFPSSTHSLALLPSSLPRSVSLRCHCRRCDLDSGGGEVTRRMTKQ